VFNLPEATEVHQPLAKTQIFVNADLKRGEQSKLDAAISRMNIVNQLSPTTINIAAGKKTHQIFVILVELKEYDYDESVIALLPKYIKRNVVYALSYGDKIRLAVQYVKWWQGAWQDKDAVKLLINGLDLDVVWENFVQQIGSIKVDVGRDLQSQIVFDEKVRKLTAEIERLETKARKEKQPRKKWELHQQAEELRRKLQEVRNG